MHIYNSSLSFRINDAGQHSVTDKISINKIPISVLQNLRQDWVNLMIESSKPLYKEDSAVKARRGKNNKKKKEI